MENVSAEVIIHFYVYATSFLFYQNGLGKQLWPNSDFFSICFDRNPGGVGNFDAKTYGEEKDIIKFASLICWDSHNEKTHKNVVSRKLTVPIYVYA